MAMSMAGSIRSVAAVALALAALPLFGQEFQPLPASDSVHFTERSCVRTPLLAVKSNLLFDAATVLNLALEAPIGQRWSVSGEAIFPWWLSERKQYCLQLFSGSLEGRYWFGRRDDRPPLTGWFAGLYAGGGYYDLEWGDRGFQGEFYIATGLSGGYAHTLGRGNRWRMEYSLGVGYLTTRYREYTPVLERDGRWHLARQRSGRYTWIGPTKASVSLVWMIHYCHSAKGGRR